MAVANLVVGRWACLGARERIVVRDVTGITKRTGPVPVGAVAVAFAHAVVANAMPAARWVPRAFALAIRSVVPGRTAARHSDVVAVVCTGTSVTADLFCRWIQRTIELALMPGSVGDAVSAIR